jgi:hypothetical protein
MLYGKITQNNYNGRIGQAFITLWGSEDSQDEITLS